MGWHKSSLNWFLRWESLIKYSVVSSWYERNKVNASSKFIYDNLEILLLSEIFAIRHWKTASSPHKFFKWFAFLDDSKSNIFLMCPFKISSFSSKLHKYKETTTFCCMVILNVYYFSSNFLTSSIFFYFLNMKYWIRKSSYNSC